MPWRWRAVNRECRGRCETLPLARELAAAGRDWNRVQARRGVRPVRLLPLTVLPHASTGRCVRSSLKKIRPGVKFRLDETREWRQRGHSELPRCRHFLFRGACSVDSDRF